MIEKRQGVIGICLIVGLLSGINIYFVLFRMFGGFNLQRNKSTFTMGSFGRFTLLRFLVLVGHIVSLHNLLFVSDDAPGSVKSDLKNLEANYSYFLLILLGFGFTYAVALETQVSIIWFSGAGQNSTVIRKLVSTLLSLAITTPILFELFFDAPEKMILRSLLHFRRKALAIIWASGFIFGITALPISILLIWKMRTVLFLGFLNFSSIIGIVFWLKTDEVVLRDLLHVLEMRMSAAIPLFILCIILGFILSYTTTEIMDRQYGEPSKVKAD